MEPETKTEAGVDSTNNETEGAEQADTIAIPKADYEKLNQTLGSLKRELKDLKKPREESKETVQTKPEDNQLLEKAFLRSAQIADGDEVELALSTAKKWGVSIDKLVDDEDFKIKLDKLRTQKSNELATSKVKGSAGGSQAKLSSDYWKAKGQPPTPADIPDRKTRAKIIREMIATEKSGGKKFYND